jgi:hypothetical protein
MAEVDWEAPYHAYESASDVPVLLSAVTVGDDPTRAAAWWQLWGNSAEPSKRRWSLRRRPLGARRRAPAVAPSAATPAPRRSW